jgi:hypothetical protein
MSGRSGSANRQTASSVKGNVEDDIKEAVLNIHEAVSFGDYGFAVDIMSRVEVISINMTPSAAGPKEGIVICEVDVTLGESVRVLEYDAKPIDMDHHPRHVQPMAGTLISILDARICYQTAPFVYRRSCTEDVRPLY